MATKTFFLKASSVGSDAGPFDVKDNLGNVIATGITRDQLLAGVDIQIDETATSITLSQASTCVSDTVIPLDFLTPLTVTTSVCNDQTTYQGTEGSTTVSASGGTAPYEYSIDGGATWQTSPTFSSLAPATYTITVKDAAGQTATTTCVVDPFVVPPLSASTTTCTDETSAGANDGTMSATPTGGVAPYEYSIDGGTTWQATGDFTSLAPNTYTITIKDAAGQTATCDCIVAPALNCRIDAKTDETGVDLNDGTATGYAFGGTAPYQYSIDNVNWQSSPTFTNLAPGSYTMYFKDAAGQTCQSTFTIAEFPIVRRSIAAVGVTAIGGPILASDNDDPFKTTSTADNLLVNPDLEAMSFKNASNEVAYQAGWQYDTFSLNGVNVQPDNTYATNGYNVINGGKEHYNYLKKIIANTFLSTRNAVIRLHRCQISPQAGKSIQTYYLFGIDFDSDTTETQSYNITEVVGKVYNTPHQITIPVDRTVNHQTVSSTQNYTFTRPLETEQIGADWAPGSVKYGLTILEQNVPIPSTW